MQILWTHNGLQDIKKVKNYIQNEASSQVAVKFVEELIKKTEILKEFPQSGRIVPEFGLPFIRELIEKRYRIVYRVSQGKVEILTIFQGKKLLPKILQE